MIRFIKNILEIFGIVFLRFHPVPRLWCVWLVAVNVACLMFISHIEAQAVFAVTLLSVVIQSLIYQRTGFTRILGIGHFSWIPMFIWIASRSETIAANNALASWLVILFLTNLVSLLIDTVDVARYVNGERRPHYYWNQREVTA